MPILAQCGIECLETGLPQEQSPLNCKGCKVFGFWRLAPAAIGGYVVYSEEANKHFLENGIHERQVFVSENYYC